MVELRYCDRIKGQIMVVRTEEVQIKYETKLKVHDATTVGMYLIVFSSSMYTYVVGYTKVFFFL